MTMNKMFSIDDGKKKSIWIGRDLDGNLRYLGCLFDYNSLPWSIRVIGFRFPFMSIYGVIINFVSS